MLYSVYVIVSRIFVCCIVLVVSSYFCLFVLFVCCSYLFVFVLFFFFFFKQKTAYEIRLSLVGSEMCIRDSPGTVFPVPLDVSSESQWQEALKQAEDLMGGLNILINNCLLYTSDAADE